MEDNLMQRLLGVVDCAHYMQPLKDLGLIWREDFLAMDVEDFQSKCFEKFTADDNFEEKYHFKWSYGDIGVLSYLIRHLHTPDKNSRYGM